jgi:hypothetical protein
MMKNVGAVTATITLLLVLMSPGCTPSATGEHNQQEQPEALRATVEQLDDILDTQQRVSDSATEERLALQMQVGELARRIAEDEFDRFHGRGKGLLGFDEALQACLREIGQRPDQSYLLEDVVFVPDFASFQPDSHVGPVWQFTIQGSETPGLFSSNTIVILSDRRERRISLPRGCHMDISETLRRSQKALAPQNDRSERCSPRTEQPWYNTGLRGGSPKDKDTVLVTSADGLNWQDTMTIPGTDMPGLVEHPDGSQLLYYVNFNYPDAETACPEPTVPSPPPLTPLPPPSPSLPVQPTQGRLVDFFRNDSGDTGRPISEWRLRSHQRCTTRDHFVVTFVGDLAQPAGGCEERGNSYKVLCHRHAGDR